MCKSVVHDLVHPLLGPTNNFVDPDPFIFLWITTQRQLVNNHMGFFQFKSPSEYILNTFVCRKGQLPVDGQCL